MSDLKKSRKEKMNDFWDIGRLVPTKPKNVTKHSISPTKIEPTEISVNISTPSSETSIGESKLTMTSPRTVTESAPSVYAEYPNFSPLIPHVKIVNWKSTYNYYEFFCRQAAALYQKQGSECPEVHFFSYVAQYSQLNRRQLDWYLWWRECVRNGEYRSTDISYIYLLIFEIINLGNAIDTRKALDILIALWVNYKEIYPQLVGALGDWICDYSLIHNLPIRFPMAGIDRNMISNVSFAESFCLFDLSNTSLLAKFLISFCNSYNYRKSKFYTEALQPLYEEHLPGALEYLLGKIDLPSALAAQPRKHISRVAFTGALCSYKNRKHIEADYISLCDSHEIRSRIGDIIKYAENKLRAFSGIRSRLGVPSLDEKTKATVDEYFAQMHMTNRETEFEHPEYEALYEAKEITFSLASALDIENRSWEVTEKLVDAFEEENETPLPPEEIEIIPSDDLGGEADETVQFFTSIANHLDFFHLIVHEDFIGQRSYISQHRILPEAVVDEINEKAADIFGDIVIEETDDGYCIMEDYRSMFEQEDESHAK